MKKDRQMKPALEETKVSAKANSSLKVAYSQQAEEQLKAVNAQLQYIYQALDVSFWGADVVNKQMLYVSPGTEKIYGYPLQDFLDNSNKWYEVILEEDKHISTDAYPELMRGNPVSFEYRIRHKNGNIKWIEARLKPTLDSDDNLIRLDGITTDITERKETEAKIRKQEEHLKEAQRIAKIGNYTYDFKTGIWKCSEALDEISGLDPVAIMEFDNWIALLSPEGRDQALVIINSIIQEGNPIKEHYLDCKINRAGTGEERWLTIMAKMEMDENGAPLRLAGTVQDITERKNAEEEVKSLNQTLERKVAERTAELVELNKELEAFSYTVSHDLQGPLRTLNGFAHLLREEYDSVLDDNGKDYVNTIAKSAKSASELIRNLLAFARLGKQSVAKVNVDMNRIVEGVLENMKLEHPDFAGDVVVHDLQPAFCDAGLIKQVWTNLIANAIKYSSKAKKPLIEIGMAANPTAYYIKDNGAGFDMKDAPKLFRVFERLHKSKDFEGTGVGLATLERIITKHGGQIWAHAEPGKGATFYFMLPAL